MHKPLGPRRPLGRAAVAIVVALLLGACASTPDWANPVEWYEGTSDWISGDDDDSKARDEARRSQSAAAGGDQAFPTLSSVPERPKRVTSESGRSKVESGLIADRDRARHEALAPGSSPPPKLASPPSAAKAVPGARPAPVIAPPPTLMAVPGAPPPPVIASPPASSSVAAAPPPSAVTPVTGTNQAFQAAINQQAGNIRPLPPTAPAMGNAGPVPTLGQGNITFRSPLARGPTFGGGRRVGTVLFANGSSRIREKYHKTLRDVVRLQRQRGGNLRVVGHASSRTQNTNPLRHQLANFRISVARAKAVARHLARLGAPAGSIEVLGMADNQRVYKEIMPSGEAGNRRAEIFLDY